MKLACGVVVPMPILPEDKVVPVPSILVQKSLPMFKVLLLVADGASML